MRLHMSNTVAVLGANGMLGCSLARHLSEKSDTQLIAIVRSEAASVKLARQGVSQILICEDPTDEGLLSDLLAPLMPNVIVNCIGLIKQVDGARSVKAALELNALLPHKLASVADQIGARLIQLSTDCVFDGERGSYTEDDNPNASDLYGKTKALGEVTREPHLTIRTSIIGHELSSAISLVDWFLSQETEVNGFRNAIFSGVPTIVLADYIFQLFSRPDIWGLYHLSAEPINKFDLLSQIASIYGHKVPIVPTDDYRIDRSLNSDRLREALPFTPIPWPEMLELMYDEHRRFF